MAEYTFKDVVYNPYEIDESYIGKTVFYGLTPKAVLERANNISSNFYVGKLVEFNAGFEYPFSVSTEYETKDYACIIIKKEEPYSERAKKWIEENDLKVGDYVKVLRKAESYEYGWPSSWIDEMDNCVSKTLKVLAINSISGRLSLECNDTGYDFPYFILKKVEKPKPKYVPFESADEFINDYAINRRERVGTDKYTYLDNLGMWLKWEGEFIAVTQISEQGINETTNLEADWQDMCDNYTFLDGSPCGKKSKVESKDDEC